jgi:hypothetical protein
MITASPFAMAAPIARGTEVDERGNSPIRIPFQALEADVEPMACAHQQPVRACTKRARLFFTSRLSRSRKNSRPHDGRRSLIMTTTTCTRSIPTMFLRGLLAVGFCSAPLVSAVHAQDRFAGGGLSTGCFTQSAVAMTPYDVSIQQNLYKMTHERVYHNTAATGSILLFGPVHPWHVYGNAASFSVTYKDPDGAGTAAQVSAQLRHVGPAGIRIISTLNSNLSARVTDNTQVMSLTVPWSQLDDTIGYYVVRVTITRTTTTVTPVALGYSLCSIIF